MDKPFIRFLFGRWWCFNSRAESRNRTAHAWAGNTPSGAYQSWARFNRMKP